MAIDEQQSSAPGAAQPPGQPPQAISQRGLARRRFSKAGLGASGVILTLVSQPGMATEHLVCTTASAAGSFKPNSHQHPTSVCEGRSPGYWKNHTGEWLGANINPQAKFGDIFKASHIGTGLVPLTMLEVLDPPKMFKMSGGDLDKDNVARHIVAALLNARSGRVSVLPESKVFEIWNDYSRTGFYSPRPNTDWNGAEIVDYLMSTMHLSKE